ncbi:SDR family NAD(P)-dependent oxidoreductase [Streptomyces sulphureus]|uniref:SDR family NAD(P)-dependent oxidoreductase n=1 Tax=Streptomyces sulphureus TaxID=47758 RepID=UPI000362E83B|nr:SDR family oxidoreductase [Streptomyces sulphureus]
METNTTGTASGSSARERRITVVTGAGTGIGRATARTLAGEGAHVLAVGRRPEPLRETADGHDGVQALAADVTCAEGRTQIAHAVRERGGGLDVLVNNAGIVRSSRLGTCTEDDLTAQLATNLTAPVLLTQALLAPLRAARGVVVNISAALGQRGWPGASVYAASKAGLDTLTRSWAVELAAEGVRVVGVAPGATETPIGEHQGLSREQREEVRRWQLAATPAGRVGRPEEVARMVTQLAAPAQEFVTGAVVPVDGGAMVR